MIWLLNLRITTLFAFIVEWSFHKKQSIKNVIRIQNYLIKIVLIIIFFCLFRIVVGFTKKTPHPKYHGILQHFFSFPNEASHMNVKSLFNDEILDKNDQKNLEIEKKNLKIFIGIINGD